VAFPQIDVNRLAGIFGREPFYLLVLPIELKSMDCEFAGFQAMPGFWLYGMSGATAPVVLQVSAKHMRKRS
jgi:hypothetical protein